ncbi:MAG: Histidine kinase [Gemmatimonadetes bacterium]|nr:Histidine kinase [Gemmatimonadota bacterium]
MRLPPDDEHAPHEGPSTSDAPDRARFEELGRVAAELLHDLANTVEALQARIRLAAGEARMGRLPLVEMERVGETAEDLGAMLHDVLEVARGAALSPEVAFDPREVAERTIRRILPGMRPLELRLQATLPDGTVVPGRESFLVRALSSLLADAARQAGSEVRVTLALDVGEDRGPQLLVSVEDDGPGVRGSGSALPATGLRSAEWAARQLGGTIAHSRTSTLGGAFAELRLPCRLPRARA